MDPQATLLPMVAGGAPETHERADARRNRELILAAAVRLIRTEGVDAVSMDEVAAEAGVGKGTLYRRFGDRSSLLRALIDEPERAFQDELLRGAPPLGPGAPPAARLHAFGNAYLSFLDGHAELIEDAERQSRGSLFAHPVYAFHRAHVLMLLREALGDDPAADYFADALMGPLQAAPFLFSRRERNLSLCDLQRSWCRLVDALLMSAPCGAPPQGRSERDAGV